MNRRRALQAVAALALPVAAQAPATDWLAQYQAAYPRNERQGPLNTCVHTMANVAMQAVALNIQGIRSDYLSSGYGYLADTGDTTFTQGSWGSKAARARETIGVCRDDLYSQEFVIANWQHGFPYPAEYLPSAACHADAPNHRLTRWQYLAIGAPLGYPPPDMELLRQLVRAGYPVTFGIERHAGCLLKVDADGYWFYGIDSNLAGQDIYGHGPGVRPYSATTLAQFGWDFSVYQEVSIAAQPLPSQAALLAQIRADAAALGDPPTQPQVDALRGHIDLLRVAP